VISLPSNFDHVAAASRPLNISDETRSYVFPYGSWRCQDQESVQSCSSQDRSNHHSLLKGFAPQLLCEQMRLPQPIAGTCNFLPRHAALAFHVTSRFSWGALSVEVSVGDYATVTDPGLDHAQRTFERIIATLSRTFGDCNRPHETVS
jgi:hypothetical protein